MEFALTLLGGVVAFILAFLFTLYTTVAIICVIAGVENPFGLRAIYLRKLHDTTDERR